MGRGKLLRSIKWAFWTRSTMVNGLTLLLSLLIAAGAAEWLARTIVRHVAPARSTALHALASNRSANRILLPLATRSRKRGKSEVGLCS
jgi:hypothetical protein